MREVFTACLEDSGQVDIWEWRVSLGRAYRIDNPSAETFLALVKNDGLSGRHCALWLGEFHCAATTVQTGDRTRLLMLAVTDLGMADEGHCG
jgi:hypothetical protein